MRKMNALFRIGPDASLNACVGRNGGPHDYAAYAEGYFAAAERLMDSVAESNRQIDALIYPIVFNFRHGVELWLKHLGHVLPPLWREVEPTKFTHLLQDNWGKVLPYLRREVQFDPEGLLIPRVDSLIRCLVETDPRGEVFRYPVSKGGEEHLAEYSILSVGVIYDAMQGAREAFEWWDFSAGYLRDTQSEH